MRLFLNALASGCLNGLIRNRDFNIDLITQNRYNDGLVFTH